jgi:TPR repeat protein
MYANGEGIKQDYLKAKEWYEKAAIQGDSDSQYNLGVMYANGEGIKQDYLKAKEWYEKAAIQGHPYSQYNLGVMYANGEGINQDCIRRPHSDSQPINIRTLSRS